MKIFGSSASGFVLAAGLAAVGLASPGGAEGAVTLEDLNSVLRIEPSTSEGVFAWEVDGTNHLFQHGYWFRTAGMTREQSLATLTLDGAFTSDGNFEEGDDLALLRYLGAGFTAEVTYVLTGGSADSGVSDLGEIVTITNTSGAALSLSLFQYSDFDLNDIDVDLDLVITGGNTARQTGNGLTFVESVVGPAPTSVQVSDFDDLVTSLEDNAITNLNNSVGPMGPTDLTWGFQWDLVIPAGGSFTINRDNSLVIDDDFGATIPEPAGLSLLGVAGLMMVRRRR